jgi:hypothetical protein
VETRPDHLSVLPPKTEETFTTPRSWHILSDALHAYGPTVATAEVELLAAGCLSPNHARSFGAFVKQLHGNLRVDLILEGEQPLPRAPEDRDVLYFLVQSFRAMLLRDLAPSKEEANKTQRELVHRIKLLLGQLASLNLEMAQLVVTPDEHGGQMPDWFLIDIVRDMPTIALNVNMKEVTA